MTPGETGGKEIEINLSLEGALLPKFLVSPPSGLKEIFITLTPGFTRGHNHRNALTGLFSSPKRP